MEEDKDRKKIITRMRPEPDFKYLARKAAEEEGTGSPLDPDVKRDPGEIRGFYAEDQKE
jgi:hypothetical protein